MAPSAAAEAHTPVEMTLDAWARLDEDTAGELVDGLLVEEEVAEFMHEIVVSWLIATLRAWAAPRSGWVVGSEHKLGLSPNRGRKPDVAVYLPGDRLPSKSASLSKTPPSIAIEVISPQPRDVRRDRVEKLAEYAGFRVRYYWLLDPRCRLLEILELGEGDRYFIALSESDGVHAVPGCEGLTLNLSALWEELDRLPESDD